MEETESIFVKDTLDFFDNIVNLTSVKLDNITYWADEVASRGSAELTYKVALKLKEYEKRKKVGSGTVDSMIKKLAKGIPSSYDKGCAKFIYLFAKEFPDVDIDEFAKSIVKKGNEEMVLKMSEYLKMPVDAFRVKYALPKPDTKIETESV